MSKSSAKLNSIFNLNESLKSGTVSPVYCLLGNDSYTIDLFVDKISRAASDLISSDFDKMVFHGDTNSIDELISAATAFPFGTGKKFILFKNFESVKDKKRLVEYLKNPADFSIVLLVHYGMPSSISSEPFSSLSSNGFLFEAKELKGRNLVNWVISFVDEKGKRISAENAQLLIDLVGEDKTLIELQLEKIFIFLNKEQNITFESIKSLSSELKEYSIFDLQDAIGEKNIEKSLSIAYSLIQSGKELNYLVFMLNRFFTQLASMLELKRNKTSDSDIAKAIKIPYYFVDKYTSMLNRFSEEEIMNAFNALIKTDTLIKTTSQNQKSLTAILITRILSPK